MNRLNNLALELVTVPGASGETRFTNPRNGWVFISFRSDEARSARIILDGGPIAHRGQTVAGSFEAMHVLRAGEHTLLFECADGSAVHDLAVRAVPELAFCKYQYDPHIREYGPYDWSFLAKHVLPHVNTVVAGGGAEQMDHLRGWKQRGGKWIGEAPLPGLSGESVTADEVFEAWSAQPGMADPLGDGLLIDEFFSGVNPRYRAWNEALRRIAADERFRGKALYPYLGAHRPDLDDWHQGGQGDDSPESSKQFFQAVLDAGYPIAWERYLPERHEQHLAEEHIDSWLGDRMKHWLAVYPDCAKQVLVCLGYMTITESMNIHPSVDYKVFMDMQFQYLATAPEFRNLFGILEYTSGYADEETVRWAARLCRHYGIEGNTELLSRGYGYDYHLNHIANPDFVHGLEGWTVPIWIEKTVAARSVERYSNLQGRWGPTTVGDSFLWMKRSPERPNTLTQTVRGLKPGALYSAKMITGSYDELAAGASTEREHGVFLIVDGVQLVPEKTFVSVIPNNYAHERDPFVGRNRFWFNYHQIVFRAKSKTALLGISDWRGATLQTSTQTVPTGERPAGPEGEELMCNFVEVQPYYGEE